MEDLFCSTDNVSDGVFAIHYALLVTPTL